MQADQEVSLLRESSQRCRQAVSPLMLALLLVRDMVQVVTGWERAAMRAVLVSSPTLMTSAKSCTKSVPGDLQLFKGDPGPLPRSTTPHFLLLECVSS